MSPIFESQMLKALASLAIVATGLVGIAIGNRIQGAYLLREMVCGIAIRTRDAYAINTPSRLSDLPHALAMCRVHVVQNRIEEEAKALKERRARANTSDTR